MTIPDKLLINLRILSKIQKNGKIAKSSDGIINLEANVFYKNIKRFLYNDNRKQSMFEINSIIDESSSLLNHLLNSKNLVLSPQPKSSEHIHNLEIIRLLVTELGKSRIGIANLKFTYKQDETVISQIDIIIIKINRIVQNTIFKLEELGFSELQMEELAPEWDTTGGTGGGN